MPPPTAIDSLHLAIDSMKHSLLIICRQSPANTALAQSALDAALAGGIFEQDIGVAFIGEAVQQLDSTKTPASEKNLAAQIQALPLYGIDAIYLDDAAMKEFDINSEHLNDLPHQCINGKQLRDIMNRYDSVVTL